MRTLSIQRLIAQRRSELEMSTDELAKRVLPENVRHAAITIQMAEKGKALIPLQWCQRLANALDVDPLCLTLKLLEERSPEACAVVREALEKARQPR